jgi:DNA-binding XRE family transcriptional regulator
LLKTKAAYEKAKKEWQQENEFLISQKRQMEIDGIEQEEMELRLQPLYTFCEKRKEDILEYEQIQQGRFPSLTDFSGVGRLLIMYRIYKGMSQRALAEKLGVEESQVSRDERNEYYGASIEKIESVRHALGMKIKITI